VHVDEVLAEGTGDVVVGDVGTGFGTAGPRVFVEQFPAARVEARAVVGGGGHAEAFVLALLGGGRCLAGSRFGGGRLGDEGGTRCVRGTRAGPFRGDEFPDRGGDLVGEPLDCLRVVGAEQEHADPFGEGEFGELLHPLVHGPVEEAVVGPGEHAVDVEQAADRGGVAACFRGGLVDDRVAAGEVAQAGEVGHARQPAVRGAAYQAEHARLVGAQPDFDGMGGGGAAFCARHPVVLAVDAQGAPLLGVPDPADDLYGFGERLDTLAGGEAAAAHGFDRVPESARAQAQFDTAAAEQVEAGYAAGQHGGLAQRQVEHVACQGDPLGAGGEVGQQGPGVEERGLVGVVLEGGEVQPGLLGELGEADYPFGILVAWREEGAETQFVAVVGQERSPEEAAGASHAPTPSSISLINQPNPTWVIYHTRVGEVPGTGTPATTRGKETQG